MPPYFDCDRDSNVDNDYAKKYQARLKNRTTQLSKSYSREIGRPQKSKVIKAKECFRRKR